MALYYKKGIVYIMKIIKFLLVSCPLLLLQTGCDDSKKKSEGIEESKAVVEEKTPVEEKAPVEEKGEVAEKTEGEVAEKVEEKESAKEENVEEGVAQTKSAAEFADGTTIQQSEVIKRIKLLPEKVQRLPFAQLYNLILFVMIQEELGYKGALKDGYDSMPEIIAQIEELSYTIAQQYYLECVSKGRITEADIVKQYEDLVKGFKKETEIGLKHILVKTEEDAKEVLKLLAEGKEFEELQKTRSIDKKTGDKKGFLGHFKKSQLPREQADLIFNTEVGKYVNSCIHVEGTGYSVLLVESKKDSEPVTLEKVRDRIISILKKKLVFKIIGELYEKCGAQMFNPDGTSCSYKPIDERLAELKIDQSETRASDMKMEKTLDGLKPEFVVAKLKNGTIITYKDILDYIKKHPSLFVDLSLAKIYATAVEECVNHAILSEEIRLGKYDEVAEVKLKFVEAKRSLYSQLYLAKVSEQLVTDETLKKSYEELLTKIDKNEMEIRLRIIKLKTKEDGAAALKELNGGKAFDVVMKKYSSDQTLIDKNGDLGYLKKSKIMEMSEELVESVAKAPKATVLPKVIEINGSCFIVRVEDKRKIEVPTFQDAKGLLKRQAIPEAMIKSTLKLIAEQKVKAYDFKGTEINLSEEAIGSSLGGLPTA